MRNVVVLGAGTGGALVANLLSHRLDLRQWTITVIDRGSVHVFQPGLLFLPFAMYGYRTEEDVVRPISAPLPRNVDLVRSDIRLIDYAKQEVQTDRGAYAYDFLISALGCRAAPEEVEGMAEEMGRRAHVLHARRSAGDAEAARRNDRRPARDRHRRDADQVPGRAARIRRSRRPLLPTEGHS
jgi:sulfide:quinone oxidoreductase